MRFHREDWSKPWPLSERLWAAKRGAWVGAVMFAAFMGIVAVPALFAMEFELRSKSGTQYGITVLVFLIGSWRVLGVILVGSIYQCWLRDLETVNRDSITFEEIVLLRLTALEARIREPR